MRFFLGSSVSLAFLRHVFETKKGRETRKRTGTSPRDQTRRVANGVALVSRNNSSRFSRGREEKASEGTHVSMASKYSRGFESAARWPKMTSSR
jgi:hypothetical protein